MGKGKKNTKNEPVPSRGTVLTSISSLTISDTPSTSNPPVEEGHGLTGGGKKKKNAKVEQLSEALPSPSANVGAAAQPEPVKIPVEEDDSGGRGITGRGKNKGKHLKVEPSVEKPASASVETKALAPAEPIKLVVEEEEDGGGLGLSGPRKPRKKKPKGTTPATKGIAPTPTEPTTIVQPSPSTSTIASIAQTPTSRSVQDQGIGQTQTQMVSGQIAMPLGRGQPQIVPRQAAMPPGQGRGFGRGQSQVSTPWQTATPSGRGQAQVGTPWQASPGGGQVPQSHHPQQPPQPQVPTVPQQSATHQPAPQQQQHGAQPMILAKYKIPSKIPSVARSRARNIKVLTNYLQMTIKPMKLYRYDVSFKPDKPKKMIPKAYVEAKKKLFPNYNIAFDQMKNCYTIMPLPNVKENQRFCTQVELTDNKGGTMPFEVSFKPTGCVDFTTIINYMKSGTSLNPPTEVIQAIDVILRQGTLESYVKAGRQFFKRPQQPIDLGEALEMWTGLFQSAIFTSQPFINVDVAHKGFPRSQPLLQAIQQDFRMDLTKPLDRQRGSDGFLHFIKGLRVVASIGGDKTKTGQRREFICNGIVAPPTKLMFKSQDERQISVFDYFAKEKRCRLQYPNLNCMWVGPRDKTIYYPIELLDVAPGQALNKQLTERQLSTMVRQAATPPSDRKRKIEEVIKDMNYSKNKYFKEFGLEISDNFYEVEAKVLEAPKLDVGAQRPIEPRRGVWMAKGLYRPEALKSWGFIAVECSPQIDYANVTNLVMGIGREMGMQVAPPILTNFNVRMDELYRILRSAADSKILFMFIVVSSRGRDHYHQVKKMAEREIGILTQCIKEQTATQRMNPQTVRNILLKVNSKLMGVNQVLSDQSMPNCLKDPAGVMVVGADVTHPSPDQASVPSIAAVTASMDFKCFQYNIALSIQTPKKEMIVEFEDMMVEHLQIYKKNRNSLPKKLFVFRDGVSEGQFAQVMASELQAIHNAYRRMTGTNIKPEVLFLLVQKRHHTRFFSIDKVPQNVEPGTVVDRHIVHARELDFYLVSHQAIKGTARPTRYHAVCNDGGICDEEVQQLAYYLCHLYSRCTRAVSYPTPTYYAHLACMRARSLTHGEKFDNAELERQPRRLRVMDKMLDNSRMFFV